MTAVDGAVSLGSCLEAFFAPEAITWACPAELKVSETHEQSRVQTAACCDAIAAVVGRLPNLQFVHIDGQVLADMRLYLYTDEDSAC